MALRSAPARPTRPRPASGAGDLLPPPVCIGLPERYTDWRPMQQEAIVLAAESSKRFIFQCAPTGFGKSLVYMGQAALAGTRTVILTSTKGLQTQLSVDFGAMGLTDIRGQNAYTCVVAREHGLAVDTSVADGPCHSGITCPKKDGGCAYFDQLKVAQRASLVVTNYTYWMHIQAQERNLGEFDLMICDEAHNTPDELSDFLGVELDVADGKRILASPVMGPGASREEWVEWGKFHLMVVKERLETARVSSKGKTEADSRVMRDVRELKRMQQVLERIASMQGDWVIEYEERTIGSGIRAPKKKVVKFDPIWPMHHAERSLFRGVPKVVMFSATVRPKTAALLGIRDGDYDFLEYPSNFPVERRRVWTIPTVKVGYKTSEGEMQIWLNRIDQIIDARRDRKGIVHTTSFRLRNYILMNSRHRDLIMANDSRNTRDTVEEFKRSRRPMVMISPSLTTGWDFPYAECEYQVVGKIMFPNTQSQIMKARTASDKDYGNYMAMQTLVQACGRGMRAADDQCETFIIDDNIGWFLARYKHFAPDWWLESVQPSRVLPGALPKLGMEEEC
jgi:ATP-dependent DNA helicase DinG